MIIGFSGLAGVGKDTCADFLGQNNNFIKLALADPIKRAAKEWWGFTPEQLWGPSEERNTPDERYLLWEKGALGSTLGGWSDDGKRIDEPNPKEDQYLTPRYALQKIGTEVARAIDSDVWVRYTMRVAEALLQGTEVPGGTVWPGYSRECGLSRLLRSSPSCEGVAISDCRFRNELEAIKRRGKIVRILRPGAGLQGEAGSHASETHLREVDDSYFDYVIDNSGTLKDLERKVCEMMEYFHG